MKPFLLALMAEWALGFTLSAVTLIRLGWSWGKSKDATVNWLIATWAIGGGVEALLFWLLGLGFHPSPWWFVASFGLVDVVAAWRLWLQR